MGFEVFTHKHGNSTTGPKVSLSKSGQFAISADAYELLGKPSHILLAFDEVSNTIGFIPSDEANPRSYPIRKNAAAETRYISGYAFRTKYKIKPFTKRRAALNDDMLHIPLKD